MKTIYTIILMLLFSVSMLSNNDFSDFENEALQKMKQESATNNPYALFNLTQQEIQWIDSTMNRLTLYEKCAQLVMPWVEARFMNKEEASYKRLVHLVKDLKVGGLIFFEGDVINQAILTNKMQEIADIPLLISADFERGVGMRLKDAIEFPYNMALGAADDTALTHLEGKIVGIEARALGVQQNYAPMVDINNNAHNPIINIRSYSEDKGIVIRHMLAFINGSHEENVLTTVKHFPGHGATDLDSHKDLPLLSQSKADFENQDLLPFKQAVAAGVKSVMVGHLEAPSLEPEIGIPATLSKNIITGILKNELGFKGLIVTDAMNMRGVTKNFPPEVAAVRAIQAGNDLIVFPPDEEAAINGIYNAVEKGIISRARIDYSVRKLLAAKKNLQIDKNKFVNLETIMSLLNKKSHFRLAQAIADASITLIKDEKGLIPVEPGKIYSTACISIMDLNYPAPYYFEEIAKKKFGYMKDISLGKKSSEADYAEALKIAEKSTLVLVPIFVKVRAFTGLISLTEQQIKFIHELSALNKSVIFMSMGNPYILSEFPEVSTYLCSYGDPKVSQNAMLRALIGDISISGKLPINIPKTPFKIGSGIKVEKSFLSIDDEEEDTTYNFSEVDRLMKNALADSVFPGAVLYIGHKDKIIYKKAFGKYTYDPDAQPMKTDAIFDLASVSKVVGTTSAAMFLFDEGKLDLDKRISQYLPEFGNHGKENITVKNLLIHNSGFTPFKPFYKLYKTRQQVIADILNSELEYPTGTKTLYSDLNMITLQLIIEKLTGKPLNEYLAEKLFAPLKMTKTMYNPPPELWHNTVPTEVDNYWRHMAIKGKVHDETAFMLGGVAGHAGLFSTAQDLSVFLDMMLHKGKYEKLKFFNPATVDLWTKKQTIQSSRALGWDTKSSTGSSAGTLFNENSFGHTGFTGTSLWVDKDRDLFVVLLSNRVYPSRSNERIISFRPRIHDAVIRAILY